MQREQRHSQRMQSAKGRSADRPATRGRGMQNPASSICGALTVSFFEYRWIVAHRAGLEKSRFRIDIMRPAYGGLIGRPVRSRFGKRIRVPKEFVEKPVHRPDGDFGRNAVIADCFANPGDWQDARDTRHAEFSQCHAQLHRCANPAKPACRVANDPGRPPEILFQEMVEQVLEGRRDAMIILSADHEKSIHAAIKLSESLEIVGRFTGRMILVHPIKQRELQLQGIYKVHFMTATLEFLRDQLRRPSAHTITTDGSEQNGDRSLWMTCALKHELSQRAAGVSTIRPPLASWRTKPSISSTGLRHGALSSVFMVSL